MKTFIRDLLMIVGLAVFVSILFASLQSAFSKGVKRNYSVKRSDSDNSTAGVQVAWLRHYNSRLLPSNSYANAIAVDRTGHAYVTGTSFIAGSASDFATVKYSPTGVQGWVAKYASIGDVEDIPSTITVDTLGNVFVAGTSQGDYVAIKYDPLGSEIWLARYDRPDSTSDGPKAISVDRLGNMYIAGSSGGDYVVIKYDVQGREEWVARYDGLAGGIDEAHALKVDDSGNVFLTGRSTGPDQSFDYATVKFDAAGVQQWVARYAGAMNSHQEALALALNTSGDVYVSGQNVTIKYNSMGIEQWVSATNGAAIGMDDFEQIYVTGSADGRITTVKLDPDGNQRWSASDNGNVVALLTDRLGNSHILGWRYQTGSPPNDIDYITVKYDSSGARQWASRFYLQALSLTFPVGLGLDENSNVFVAGVFLSAYVTIKYDKFGQQKWFVRYYDEHGANFDEPVGIDVDCWGNIRVVGHNGGLYRALVVSYDSTGAQQWANQDYNLYPNTMAMDCNGNTYAAGFDFRNPAMIKYRPDGSVEWKITRPEEGQIRDITIDDLGNIYVVGGFTAKYSPSGIEQWSNDSVDGVVAAVDKQGNVYSILGDLTRKLSPSSGAIIWTARYSYPGAYSYSATDLAVDKEGNVYVVGKSVNSLNTGEQFTVKYDSLGIEQWADHEPLMEDFIIHAEKPVKAVFDGSGDLVVAGTSNADYLLIKFSPDGSRRWVIRYSWGVNSKETLASLAVDQFGSIYVTGFSNNYPASNGPLTVKFDQDGILQWKDMSDRYQASPDKAKAITVDWAGNVYVTAQGGRFKDMTTIKYGQITVDVKEKEISKPQAFYLMQNNPNPFNPSTIIRYAAGSYGHVTLKVYNLLGQEVAKLVDEPKPAGRYEIRWTPVNLLSGVYLYRLQAGDFIETKKLMLLK